MDVTLCRFVRGLNQTESQTAAVPFFPREFYRARLGGLPTSELRGLYLKSFLRRQHLLNSESQRAVGYLMLPLLGIYIKSEGVFNANICNFCLMYIVSRQKDILQLYLFLACQNSQGFYYFIRSLQTALVMAR